MPAVGLWKRKRRWAATVVLCFVRAGEGVGSIVLRLGFRCRAGGQSQGYRNGRCRIGVYRVG